MRQFAEGSTEARDKLAAFQAARRQVADLLHATAKERAEAVAAIIGGEAKLDAFVALDAREQALRRLAAQIEADGPELNAAAEAEREWERDAPARAERQRKQAKARALREKIWDDPRNAERRFKETMGWLGPKGFLEDRIVQYMRGLVRTGDPQEDEPAHIIADAQGFEAWLNEEQGHLQQALSWDHWVDDLVKRRHPRIVFSPSNGFNPGWANRQD